MFRRISIQIALILGDMAVIILALLLASWVRPQLHIGQPIALENVWPELVVFVMALVIWAIGFTMMDVYTLRKNLNLAEEIQRIMAAHAAATLAFAGCLYFSFRNISRLQVAIFALFSLILLLTFRLLLRLGLHFFGEKRYGTRRVLIVGASMAGQEVAHTITAHSWTGLRLVGYVSDPPIPVEINSPYLGLLDQAIEVVTEHQINEVIFALPRNAHARLGNLVATLHALNVNVRMVPDFFDLVFLRSVVEDLGEIPLITLKEPVLNPVQRLVKRGFDLVLGTLGFLVALPLMAFIAIGIKYDSPGPIMFTQPRVGENGRIFKMIKFRTMFHDPERLSPQAMEKIIDGQPVYKFYDDPRVTRFGRFLRRTSLDELPQFINVLKGDMSLIGPRPELPWLVEQYEPWQRKRFEVPQGLTGWWQVNGRADNPMHLSTHDDLYYIKHYSLWLDVKILWRTVSAVLSRRGSY
ncbi:MAG: UDP-glucose:undecaprenyl-phosphate glucose-1-phosphate transferase [Anaerolineae bacterium]|nr:UDP-glucose:undecaprenyl-phosphate glucose-1-phosphate transferase [Anaerolineae bacterium]